MDEEGQPDIRALIAGVRERGIEVTIDQDAILRGIGLVAMVATHLERSAQALLTALVGGGQASVLIVGQNFAFIYQGLRSVLAQLPDTEEYREAGELIERANRLMPNVRR